MRNCWLALLLGLILTACVLPGNLPATPNLTSPATVIPTIFFLATPTPIATVPITFTAIPFLIPTQLTPSSADICTDPQVTTLLDSFQTALSDKNGALLSSLVSPSHGMDVRYFRDGKVVNYDKDHAKFVFETDYQAAWGLAPASGLEVKGSFHELIVPDLLKVFGQSHTLHCNQLKYGGVTYQPIWPYQGAFYSAYFAGTDPYGGLDWRTWAIGVE